MKNIITAALLVTAAFLPSCTAVVNPPVDPTTSTTTTTQTDRSLYGTPTTTRETQVTRNY